MKRKINLILTGVSITAVLCTTLFVTLVYYGLFTERIKNDLRLEAHLLAKLDEKDYAFIPSGDIRLTVIDRAGNVIYDNDANALDNHADRPEVKMAIESGEGESTRVSATLNRRTFYYALRLDNGGVIRLAKETHDITAIFISALPAILTLAVLVLLLCLFLSRMLAKRLLDPIKEMAEEIGNAESDAPYVELKPFLRRIREQHRDILAAAKLRQDFSANVSHELKTPLTAISGYAELIESGMVTGEQAKKFGGEIEKQVKRLVSLINDIIKLSELDGKERLTEYAPTDVLEVARERVELLQGAAAERKISLTLQGEACVIMSSRELLIELVDNIIGNAIRYNVEGGTVNVFVRTLAGGRCEFKVADTGIGIPAADCERVFERFYRVDKGRSRETGGTGLGLSLVKHIVELHGGSIDLKSELGKGTTLTVTI